MVNASFVYLLSAQTGNGWKGGLGAAASLLERNAGATTIGISHSLRFVRAYSNGWRGNGSVTTAGLGEMAGAAGAAFAAYNTYNVWTDPNNSTAKAGNNTVMTAVGFAGPLGAAAAVVYYGVDTFVPGGWGTRPDNVRGVNGTIGWFFFGN